MYNNLSPTQKKTLIFGIFCFVIVVFFLAGGQQMFSLDYLQQNRQALLDYADKHYGLLFFISALIYVLTTTFSLPGATILSLAIGFIFGRWTGTLLIVFSATAGATLVFLLARYLFADWAREHLQDNEQAAKIINGFQSDAFNYLLFLRLVPLFPFWLVNLAPAFTPIPTQTFMLATFIGIIPGSFVFANLGQSLAQIEHPDQLLSTPVFVAFSLLGLLALAPVIYKRYKDSLSRT
jgi:uncharacterized membrane protein YdjX (TVP38/TMEM64 family)